MENAKWLVAEWSANLADVMQAMADIKPQMESTSIESLPKGDFLWWKQPFSCAHDAPFWVGAPESSWTAIGQLVLSCAGVENPPAADLRGTYLEIIGQSMGGVAREIGQRLSAEVTCDGGAESQAEPSTNRAFEVTARTTGSQQITFYLVAGTGLTGALSVPVPVQNDIADGSRPPAVSDERSTSRSRTFELLLDVELPISVSFGRTLLRIQDALNLVSGSLIELDRAVADPVELLVNNSVIARGEIVVIEGNYGIRLTEIISHKERLQQSRRYILS